MLHALLNFIHKLHHITHKPTTHLVCLTIGFYHYGSVEVTIVQVFAIVIDGFIGKHGGGTTFATIALAARSTVVTTSATPTKLAAT